MRIAPLLATLVVLPAALGAQNIVSVDGRDEFGGVEYVGGDATMPKSKLGWLVISDSMISLHECTRQYCEHQKKGNYYKPEPIYSIRLQGIKSVESSSDVRGASVGSKLALGFLAGDRKQEFVGVIYETETNAEAPVFKTQKAQSAAVEAKLKFRLKRLGIELRQSAGESNDQ